MNPMKSSNQNTRVGIVGAMRPIWRTGIATTAALSTVLAVVFAIAIDGCSSGKSNKTEVTSSSRAPLPDGSTPGNGVATLPDLSAQPAPTVKRSKVEHRLTAIYADDAYGVSFRYPRTYSLVTPENTKLNQSLEKIPMNFVQPGGVSLATIALPHGPATSLFHVNVNQQLTAQACQQFAVPDGSPVHTSDDAIPVKVSRRGGDFTRVENGTEQNDLRYYHHFENGACYEFAMAVQEQDGNTKAVDHFGLFDQLEQIMATVQIKPESVPAVTAKLPQTPAKNSNPR
jgi:hypothetical protein